MTDSYSYKNDSSHIYAWTKEDKKKMFLTTILQSKQVSYKYPTKIQKIHLTILEVFYKCFTSILKYH